MYQNHTESIRYLKNNLLDKHKNIIWLKDAINILIETLYLPKNSTILLYFLPQKHNNIHHLLSHQHTLLTESVLDTIQTIDETIDKKKILDLIDIVNHFKENLSTQLILQEHLLNNTSDLYHEHWGCSNCMTINQKNLRFCKTCRSCKTHGESDCRNINCRIR